MNIKLTHWKPIALGVVVATILQSCTPSTTRITEQVNTGVERQKPVVYQVFTRLFGNTNTTNMPWGTKAQNGVGKFNDFTPEALDEIRQLGVSHVWYTGVPHHALVADYTEYGITLDDPDVIKGRAGSPYAVKDYYSVNPDLATNPANRVQEFEALIKRTHDAGMKVIIDIVPNHVARRYQSLYAPDGVEDFGASDNTSVTYSRDNNFYYVVNEAFDVPTLPDALRPLGGDTAPLLDGKFEEYPAKWTGNGARTAKPKGDDWYETVKVNYGVKPDGNYDFPSLPDDYRTKDYSEHAAFWKDKDLPDSWHKFHHIVHYWLDKGVDGFRYDMAEMVPVEFWSYLNSSIKIKNPDAFILAEVYNPSLYRDYIQLGKMDYLYDKVEFYDTLKAVMQQKQGAAELVEIQTRLQDIESHMLHFLENHDEQRIASPEFAGNAQAGKPAMVVSALISRSPTMLYFGQEVGEDGSEDMGFGKPSRTTIFDYAGVPAHQRWMNNGEFDGGQLSDDERELRAFYKTVLNISAFHPSMQGEFVPLQAMNLANTKGYTDNLFSFIRSAPEGSLLVVSNFDRENLRKFTLSFPAHLLGESDAGIDLLTDKDVAFTISGQSASAELSLSPNESVVIAW
ncbi:alpha-amylase family protein [Aestuariibacter sp. AA17]|uniref:Alpha-amylase family protein n=1 Tax=Fluctibacter corallii TaxID=2984329 RepID=A0ABT3A9I7_9ALTE|nr:alpha-amylase family protein [Aestuariibacter sp. AA17]MCV2885340.1 alpha-amylase family protein [Aestuariibacter sp. AA17]